MPDSFLVGEPTKAKRFSGGAKALVLDVDEALRLLGVEQLFGLMEDLFLLVALEAPINVFLGYKGNPKIGSDLQV